MDQLYGKPSFAPWLVQIPALDLIGDSDRLVNVELNSSGYSNPLLRLALKMCTNSFVFVLLLSSSGRG